MNKEVKFGYDHPSSQEIAERIKMIDLEAEKLGRNHVASRELLPRSTNLGDGDSVLPGYVAPTIEEVQERIAMLDFDAKKPL